MEKVNRNKRVEIAERIMRVIDSRIYEAQNGSLVSVAGEIQNCMEKTVTISPEDGDDILYQVAQMSTENYQTAIKVLNGSTIWALSQTMKNTKVGVLNFASAKNPGGGFLSGASAQEESLARASCLYASQTKDMTMYQHNRNQSSFLYSDYMIYSPDVIFWFDDEGNTFPTPIKADIITSPAPNKGAMLQHNRKDEIAELESVFKYRMEKLLALAVKNGVESLILGAWGCGVFRNEPSDVANYFREIIDTKFKNRFREIIFSIYDTSDKKANFLPFQQTFQ